MKNLSKTTIENSNKKQVIPVDQLTCVLFESKDGIIKYAIPCSQNDVFVDIEKLVYQQYPDYIETNNYFIANGSPILRFKTITENIINS